MNKLYRIVLITFISLLIIAGATAMAQSETENQIDKILLQQQQIRDQLDKHQNKDAWDKFSIITSFVSGVLLVCVGGLFTYFFQTQQTQRQLDQQDEQRKLEEHRNRLLELDAVSSLLPFITDPDETRKKAAYLALNTLASTKIVAELAKLNPSDGAATALSAIASSPSTEEQDRKFAESALNDIFLKNRSAVVRIQTGMSMASGFFVSDDGYLITVDFAVPKQEGDITIITLSGETQKVDVIAVNNSYGIALLKAKGKVRDFLVLADNPPKIEENILIIGSTATEHLIPTLGRVQSITEQEVEYWREREKMAGTAGGPVMNRDGLVIGIHRSGWKSKSGLGGIGQCLRADKIKSVLRSMRIKVDG